MTEGADIIQCVKERLFPCMCPNLSGNHCIAGYNRSKHYRIGRAVAGSWNCIVMTPDRLCRIMSLYSPLQQARMKVETGHGWQAYVPNLHSREASCESLFVGFIAGNGRAQHLAAICCCTEAFLSVPGTLQAILTADRPLQQNSM
jgi:hypothetical protein